MKRCYRCVTEWREEKRPSLTDVCEQCSAYIHCCLNCVFYDEHAHNHCRIPTTDWVGDVEKGNFCDEFTFADGEKPQTEDREDAGKAWKKLWGNPG